MRKQLIEFLKKELIGPDPVSPLIQENGEEILINEPPRLRYGAAILFPQGRQTLQDDSVDDEEKKIMEESVPDSQEDIIEDIIDDDAPLSIEELDANDDTLNLANAFLPSAMGFSCFVDVPLRGLKVRITAGRYKVEDVVTQDKEGNRVSKRGYLREPLDTEMLISKKKLPDLKKRSVSFEIKKNDENTHLVLNVRNRTLKSRFDKNRQLYTFTLLNTLASSGSRTNNENCFFQAGFSVIGADNSSCFLPYDSENPKSFSSEEESANLLYRNNKTFAIGHGCSPAWVESDGNGKEVRTEIIPAYEMLPVVPSIFPDLQLKMIDMSNDSDTVLLARPLHSLKNKYGEWIEEQEELANTELSGRLRDTALHHIENCKKCLTRIEKGIRLLEEDPDVRKAFALMNRAMLTQQLRYGLKLREWSVGKDKSLQIKKIHQPDINNPITWPDWSAVTQSNMKYGSWYPFQIAFILMNLKSIAAHDDKERNTVDLIWFTTGGGKTEAYLGLTAYTIFLKRLRNENDTGTTVLMRYTLRLLTAQQFQRAASLICACEIIRAENAKELGNERISIGLWVGKGLSPNDRSHAVRTLKQMTQGTNSENPFVVLKCPWCGAQMGFVNNDRQNRVQGYRTVRNPSTVIFRCKDSDCEFSKEDFNLPLLVIDEDIYESPPSLVIGTVDKFAMISWKPGVRSLFGFRDKQRVTPPELIIQDELHLISGPLGSMVGHYEMLVNELCTNQSEDIAVRPKIIASTATISKAAEQCNNLYSCGEDNVFLFPPQCIDAGETFFARIDKDSPGRIYLGIHASGIPAHAVAQVRVISALLQGVKSANVDDKKRNFYWTILNYFNSLRELGHAATLVSADIREYLNAMRLRKGIHKTASGDPRRFINSSIELTSRKSSTEIPQALQELEIDYPAKNRNCPVDICLSTSMISVGVDVPRLGLMTIIGQPKTSSEYIQASSRVGRSKDGPGLVAVIYNVSKPRDRSHYERFNQYHSRIYSEVEPTSVTPFSSPVRERALHAVLVGYIRHFGSKANMTDPQSEIDKSTLDNIRKLLENRVSHIDPDEYELTLKLLDERIQEWCNRYPSKYGDFSTPTPVRPLMYPAGTSPHEDWELLSWPTPSSMRNVDATCEAGSIGNYSSADLGD